MGLKFKKILAGITGIGLVILILAFANSLIGNPISSLLAKNATKKYIHTNYGDLDLFIQGASYNFKVNSYFVTVASQSSKDTRFNIYVNSYGEILRDDYEYEVANNFTTYRRLNDELKDIGHTLIKGKLDYDFDSISLWFVKEYDLTSLQLDMHLDIHNPPMPLTIFVTLFDSDRSYDKIAEVAKALEHIFNQNNIPITDYSILILPLENKPQDGSTAVIWANALSLNNFPAKRLNEENLAQVMEQFELDQVNDMEKKDKK